MNQKKAPTELILRPDGSIYHLNVRPGEVADTVILVGDPGRVPSVSGHFRNIEHTSANREMVTHTGSMNGRRISVISTGMGPDNIDIVLNELDALFNFDFETRSQKAQLTRLKILRLGTCGSLQADVPAGSFVASSHGLGLDGILHFYHGADKVTDAELTEAFFNQTDWPENLPTPYIVKGSEELMNRLGEGFVQGITATSMGFYGPQGRVLRLPLAYGDLNSRLGRFEHDSLRIINYEMETAALYGLGKMLGHQALTICLVLANRVDGTYLSDYQVKMDELIATVLERLTS